MIQNINVKINLISFIETINIRITLTFKFQISKLVSIQKLRNTKKINKSK